MPKLKPETLAARKTQILKAALVCFASRGYHQTSIDDIAQEAGLSKGGVYAHFDSKNELFLALFEEFTAEFELATVSITGSTAAQKLTGLLESFISTMASEAFKDTASLLITVWAQNIHNPELEQATAAQYMRFRQPLIEVLEEGIANREFKAVNPVATASILLAVLDGLMVQARIDPAAIEWRVIAQTLNTLLSGLEQ